MDVTDVFEPNGRNGAPTSWATRDAPPRSRTSPLEAYEGSRNVANGASTQKGFIVDPSTSFVASKTPETYGARSAYMYYLLLVFRRLNTRETREQINSSEGRS